MAKIDAEEIENRKLKVALGRNWGLNLPVLLLYCSGPSSRHASQKQGLKSFIPTKLLFETVKQVGVRDGGGCCSGEKTPSHFFSVLTCPFGPAYRDQGGRGVGR